VEKAKDVKESVMIDFGSAYVYDENVVRDCVTEYNEKTDNLRGVSQLRYNQDVEQSRPSVEDPKSYFEVLTNGNVTEKTTLGTTLAFVDPKVDPDNYSRESWMKMDTFAVGATIYMLVADKSKRGAVYKLRPVPGQSKWAPPKDELKSLQFGELIREMTATGWKERQSMEHFAKNFKQYK
jgi:hypothetical protein